MILGLSFGALSCELIRTLRKVENRDLVEDVCDLVEKISSRLLKEESVTVNPTNLNQLILVAESSLRSKPYLTENEVKEYALKAVESEYCKRLKSMRI